MPEGYGGYADILRAFVRTPPPVATMRWRASLKGSLTTFMCQPLA